MSNKSTEQSVQPNRFRGIEVLVIDDEIDSLNIITLVLEQEGADVTPVASAAEALDTLKVSTPDLIISDIGMPEVDGYTLLNKIRSLPQGQIPAIALSAYAGEVNRIHSLEAGFQEHLDKPVDIYRLLNVAVQLLQLN